MNGQVQRTFRVLCLSQTCQAYVAELCEAMAANPSYHAAMVAWIEALREEGIVQGLRHRGRRSSQPGHPAPLTEHPERLFADHDSLPYVGRTGTLVRWLPSYLWRGVQQQAMALLEFEGGGRQVFRAEQVEEVPVDEIDGATRAREEGSTGEHLSDSSSR